MVRTKGYSEVPSIPKSNAAGAGSKDKATFPLRKWTVKGFKIAGPREDRTAQLCHSRLSGSHTLWK